MNCAHAEIVTDAHALRLEDEEGTVRDFMLELTMRCAVCGARFRFLGLPPGLDLRGARASPDGFEARLAAVPEGAPPGPAPAPRGYAGPSPPAGSP